MEVLNTFNAHDARAEHHLAFRREGRVGDGRLIADDEGLLGFGLKLLREVDLTGADGLYPRPGAERSDQVLVEPPTPSSTSVGC